MAKSWSKTLLMMRRNWIAVVAVSSLLLSAGAALAQNELDGALPPTEEEELAMELFWPKVVWVSPNELGGERINAERRRKGLAALGENAILPMGGEVLSMLEGEPLPRIEATSDLPLSVDNSELLCFPPIGDQAPFPSCVSFAITYYQLTHNMGLYLGIDNKNGDGSTWFSPKWTYNFLNGGGANYTSVFGNYSIIEQHGAVTWAEFPYDDNCLQWCLDPIAWRYALNSRTNTPEIVTEIDTNDGLLLLKEMLVNGYVLVFHLRAQFQLTLVSDDPSTTEDDAYVGQKAAFWLPTLGTRSHLMNFVGYNDHLWIDVNSNGVVDSGEKGRAKVADSHGTGAGNDGFFWFAYDLLKEVSAVDGGPSSSDRAGIDECYHLPIRPNYTPSLIAEFTVNHAVRNQLGLELGTGSAGASKPSTTWTPSIIRFQGGDATAVDGTFVYDFTDLMPSGSEDTRYFIELIDKNRRDEVATLSMFKLIDMDTQAEVYSETVPIVADGTYGRPASKRKYAHLNYAIGGNIPPVAEISADPTSGLTPLTVDFDGSGSYDSDGTIVSYSWDFGDGNSDMGMYVSHTYTSSGIYTAALTVTDDAGAESSDWVDITVDADDPDFIAPPSNLDGFVSSGIVTLVWDDNSDNEEGFAIERGRHPSYVYQQVGLVDPNVTIYEESPGRGRYRYRVQAFNLTTGRVSDYSNSIQLRVK